MVADYLYHHALEVNAKAHPDHHKPAKRIPNPMTNAEIPANKNADDSACLKRTGLVFINASRRRVLSARTISTMPIAKKVDARIYFHMAVLHHDELFVMFEPFKYLVDVIHWFQATAKGKLHN
jgi:hypothetical protein